MEKWDYVLQGDLEAAMIDILRTAPEIMNFPGGPPRISTTLDGFNQPDDPGSHRWITVSHEGGSFDWPVIAQARIDYNVYAESRTLAHDLAQIALAVLFREMGQPSPDYGLRTLEHKVETGLVRADDRMNDSPRYIFALRTTYVPYNP